MKVSNNKINVTKIFRSIFFVGSFFIASYVAIILIIAAFNVDQGLKASFLVSLPSISVLLIIITFCMYFYNIISAKNNKIYTWVLYTTLITVCMSLIEYIPYMSNNQDLFFDRKSYGNYFYRLNNIILPFCFLLFYLGIDNTKMNKKHFWFLIIYPILYIGIFQILEFLNIFNRNNANQALQLNTNSENHFVIEFIQFLFKVYFKFSLLVPVVLGIFYIKEEIILKKREFILVYIGAFLVTLSLGGFWYPLPFEKTLFKKLISEDFGHQLTNLRKNISHDTTNYIDGIDNTPDQCLPNNSVIPENSTPPTKLPSILDRITNKVISEEETSYIHDLWRTGKLEKYNTNKWSYTYKQNKKMLILENNLWFSRDITFYEKLIR